jgi:large subunit ribosomal protein L21e
MVRKSYGRKRGTRRKFRVKVKPTITRFLSSFEIGQKVHIDICPSEKGFPHPKFQGKTGVVIGKRGNAYIVEVKNMKTTKNIIAKPEHLKAEAIK